MTKVKFKYPVKVEKVTQKTQTISTKTMFVGFKIVQADLWNKSQCNWKLKKI